MTVLGAPLARRAGAEAVGTGLLVAVVVGSGIQAQNLTADNGLALLANSLATVFGLGVLIVLLGPVSGAHFNPVVTVVTHLVGSHAQGRHGRAGTGEVAAYVIAQVVGGAVGAVLANAMFARSLVAFSHHDRSAAHLWLGEVVATAGLVFLILGLARDRRPATVAGPAVAAYIGAAYWFTSSTSFANPAVTLARALTDTFTGIAPASVPMFLAAQVLGGAIGAGLVVGVFGRPTPTPADVVSVHPEREGIPTP